MTTNEPQSQSGQSHSINAFSPINRDQPETKIDENKITQLDTPPSLPSNTMDGSEDMEIDLFDNAGWRSAPNPIPSKPVPSGPSTASDSPLSPAGTTTEKDAPARGSAATPSGRSRGRRGRGSTRATTTPHPLSHLHDASPALTSEANAGTVASHAKSTPTAGRSRGRGGRGSTRGANGHSAHISVATVTTPNGHATEAHPAPAIVNGVSTPTSARGFSSTRARGRGRGRGGRGGVLGKRRRDSDEIRAEDSPSDEHQSDLEEGDEYTPQATATRSGRSVQKPASFVPSAVPSPVVGLKRKRQMHRKNPELTVCTKRSHLERVPQPVLINLLIHASRTHPDIPILPPDVSARAEALSSMPPPPQPNGHTSFSIPPTNGHTTTNGPSQLQRPADDELETGYESDPPAHYPIPGQGLAATLPPERNHLSFLVDDNHAVYTHLFQSDPKRSNESIFGAAPTSDVPVAEIARRLREEIEIKVQMQLKQFKREEAEKREREVILAEERERVRVKEAEERREKILAEERDRVRREVEEERRREEEMDCDAREDLEMLEKEFGDEGRKDEANEGSEEGQADKVKSEEGKEGVEANGKPSRESTADNIQVAT
ncbi:Pantothenate kinase [Sphaceloma murrayae]|uniref:Pantothenate kinase n=1 Tax=Sphaceloma murrayae TaxID=2082308 RepID=A0A2K1QKU9_9PEZI|nr:Pantothenate kinase [Sphaceloma murrayae]